MQPSDTPNDIVRLEGKMQDMMDNVLGRGDGLVKVAHPNASMSNYTQRNYRSSFLTLSDMQIPDDFRQIFRWCRYFFKFDSLIGAAVRSLATFPVTEIIYNDTKEAEEDDTSDESSETYKFYTNMFKEINLYQHLIEVGYDYFLYGNCIIFAEPGVKTVRRRNPENPQEIVATKEVVWKSIERLDLTRVKIDRDPKTKEKIYYYDIPADMKRIIKTKSPKEKYDRIPEVFKKAVEKKGILKLNSDYIFHLSMPAESGDSGLWATPPVMQAMKLILYMNILRQAQEAIAYEHIVPRRIYFFQETTTLTPEYNFSKIADDFAFELRKQLNDPNYQVISPVPVNQIQHGGQGRSLLLVPEIEQLQNTILAAMGVPREFVFGGMSYSGSTVSLRIVENNFLTYRVLLDNYVNEFLVKRLARIRGEWEVPDDDNKVIHVEFSELKMQDDIQQKTLMVNLNQSGKMPDEILYEKVFGLDAQKIFDMRRNEQIRMINDNLEMQILQAQAQVKLQQKLTELGIEMAPVDPDADPNAGGAAAAPGNQQDGAAAQPQVAVAAAPAAAAQASMDNQQAMAVAHQFLELGNEGEQAQFISKLPQPDAQRVMHYVMALKQREEDAQSQQIDMRPAPEQLPPRRQGGV